MRIVGNLDELSRSLKERVVTIGNFDGVHLAHQELLRRVANAARARNAEAAAVTFEPHPLQVLAPERAPARLTSPETKSRLIEKFGIDLLVVLPFTAEFSRLSPAEFVRRVLVERLRTISLYVGPTFRFGHGRAGDARLLSELGKREGFELQVLPILRVRDEPVSSSRIRDLLLSGSVGRAGRLLGRPYSVSGAIVPGLGIGRKQTVPTLNLAPIAVQLPKVGVYITRTSLGGVAHESASNVGYKPTVGRHPLTVESFLLNFSGEIAEHEMEVEFLHRLRDEIKFPSPEALKGQIQHDARRSIKFFRLLNLFQERRWQRVVPTGQP